jgi:hypothetical protein
LNEFALATQRIVTICDGARLERIASTWTREPALKPDTVIAEGLYELVKQLAD